MRCCFSFRNQRSILVKIYLFIFLILFLCSTSCLTMSIEAILPLGKQEYLYNSESRMGWTLQSNLNQTLALFGEGFVLARQPKPLLSFTTNKMDCEVERIDWVFVMNIESENRANVTITVPHRGKQYFMCLRNNNQSTSFPRWVHQGDDARKTFNVHSSLLPLWTRVICILILLMVSGLFSGLNLGLMSVTPQDLDIIISSNEDPKMVRRARTIQPIRSKGNFLLCTILLGNVLVNAFATVMLESIVHGFFAVAISTLGIVVIGEIIPQAFCSRHGLKAGASTISITKLFMVLTFPLSYPLSLILDHCLGAEAGSAYTRGQIVELIKRNAPLMSDTEKHILDGILALNRKRVGDIMVPLRDVFMLNEDSGVSPELFIEIYKKGFTRIPVYSESRDNVVGLVHMRDFAFIDPDNYSLSVHHVLQIFNHPLGRVDFDTGIMNLFDIFKQGAYHISLVEKTDTNVKSERITRLVGIVTLEDVIEEIFQSEIYDEWDHVNPDGDVCKKKKRILDYSSFLKPHKETESVIPAQQKVAMFQFLSTAVEAFKPHYISPNVLRKLINTPHLIVEYRCNRSGNSDNETIKRPSSSSDSLNYPVHYLYEYGKPVDHFILILSGRARLETGQEKIVSEVGSFAFFGTTALLGADENIEALIGSSKNCPRPIRPDFSLCLTGDLTYMTVTRAIWLAAVRTSVLEKHRSSKGIGYIPEENYMLDEQLRKISAQSDVDDTDTKASGANHRFSISKLSKYEKWRF